MNDLERRLYAALNRLAKWRSVFAGWQLGTRDQGDAELKAVKDHREVTIVLRAEVNALAGLMLDKGVFSVEEWQQKMLGEIEALERSFEDRFPGFEATDLGIKMDLEKAKETTIDWRP